MPDAVGALDHGVPVQFVTDRVNDPERAPVEGYSIEDVQKMFMELA